MATKIQVRRDTAANWTGINPTLDQGEIGFETDTSKMKIGNGIDAWTSLSYPAGGDVTGPGASVDGEIALYDSTTGKVLKRATTTGLLKGTSGVISAAVSGTDIKTINSTSLLGSGDITVAVTGANTFTGDQTGGDNDLVQWMLKDVGAVYLDKGTINSGTVTFAYTDGSHQRLQVGGALTIATSAWPPTGNNGSMMIELVNGGATTITWPTINWIKSDGTTTTTFSANGVTLQSSGTDFCVLWTRDAGTTIYGKFVR
jgi:hypothetical protein